MCGLRQTTYFRVVKSQVGHYHICGWKSGICIILYLGTTMSGLTYGPMQQMLKFINVVCGGGSYINAERYFVDRQKNYEQRMEEKIKIPKAIL